jgi:hypothetical protein
LARNSLFEVLNHPGQRLTQDAHDVAQLHEVQAALATLDVADEGLRAPCG